MHLWRQLSSKAPSAEGSPEGSEDETPNSITKPVKKLLCSVGLSRNSTTSQGGGECEPAGAQLAWGLRMGAGCWKPTDTPLTVRWTGTDTNRVDTLTARWHVLPRPHSVFEPLCGVSP